MAQLSLVTVKLVKVNVPIARSMNKLLMNSYQPNHDVNYILIVESRSEDADFLSGILVEQGYEVQVVCDREIVLEIMQNHLPALILLNPQLFQADNPEDSEIYHQLKALVQAQSIPILFTVNSAAELDKNEIFTAPGLDYLLKPFHPAEVSGRVAIHLTLQNLKQQIQQQEDQLKQEVKARKQVEGIYHSIFENCLEGIFQTTPDGYYLSANPALARMFGFDSPKEMITSMINISESLYVRPGRLDELHAYLQLYNQVIGFESQVYRKDGSTIWISENVRAVRDDNGNLMYYEGTVQNITEQKKIEAELRLQRRETERLLLSILPQSIAERLKRKNETIADSFAEVTVLFADVVNFTALSSRLTPTILVDLLNQIFSSFDQLAERYGLEKIKTIGDEYMVAGGLPVPRPYHAEAIADMALAMQQQVLQFKSELKSELWEPLQLRIGINTGPVIAGVIGTKKFTYDLWGSAVNLASRMQSQGLPGNIQVAPTTYQRLRNRYILEERGIVDVKGFGEMTTYWLKSRKT